MTDPRATPARPTLDRAPGTARPRHGGTAISSTFQVDLRGVVDLLSHHLYSSPRVYLRELVQNAVDAVTVRGAVDDRPALLLVPTDHSADGRLHAHDSGVGLDEDDVRGFLATIGRSSKRDDLGLARTDLLGQFGIGLLSCFMVTDAVDVLTRREGGRWVRWTGRADGSYDLVSGADAADVVDAGDERVPWLEQGPGTCVALASRRGSERYLDATTVLDLAHHHAAYLPHRVVVRLAEEDVAVSPVTPPWRLADPQARRAGCERLAVDHLGGTPFQVLPVTVPQAGLDGVVVVSGQPGAGTRQGRHRVHLKGMLLSDQVPDLLPDWAFFARCAVDSTVLRPTASREGLYDDELLEHTRTALGEQLRAWLLRLAATDPARTAEFLRLHHLAVKAMAVEDDEMLRILLPLLPFETNQGTLTLPALRATTDVVHVTPTVDDFRQVAAVLAAQGVAVVNGGYVFDLDLLRRAAALDDDLVVEQVAAGDVDAHVRAVGEHRLRETAAALHEAREALDPLQVDVELRDFAPPSLAALLVDDRAARSRRESRAAAEGADDTWAAVLGALDDGGSARPQLLLNDASPTVRRVLAVTDPTVRRLAVESLYCRALLSGGHPLRPADAALLDRSFHALLDLAVDGAAPDPTEIP